MESKSFSVRRDVCLLAILGSLVIALEWRAQDDLEAEFANETQSWRQEFVARNAQSRNKTTVQKNSEKKRDVASEGAKKQRED